MALTRKSRKLKSGLPPPIPGEPFSLIGTLRRCTRPLTAQDAADLQGCSLVEVYNQVKAGEIPTPNLGRRMVRIDPKAWAYKLEHDNPHLMPSVREHLKAARAAAAA